MQKLILFAYIVYMIFISVELFENYLEMKGVKK